MSPDTKPRALAPDATEIETHLVSHLLAAIAESATPLTQHAISKDVLVQVKAKAKIKRVRPYSGSVRGRAGSGKFRFVRKGDTESLESPEQIEAPDVSASDLALAVRKALRGTVAESGGQLVLLDPNVLRIAEVVDRALPSARDHHSEATIEKLVDALVETQDPVATIRAQIDARNAKARVAFMGKFMTYSAEEVTAESGSQARNRSQTASRWKSEGKIFSIPWLGQERFPAFQFKDGRPLAVIADVLRALPDSMSAWETAFWFVSTNGWLDGAAPCDKLADARIVDAARLEGEAVIG